MLRMIDLERDGSIDVPKNVHVGSCHMCEYTPHMDWSGQDTKRDPGSPNHPPLICMCGNDSWHVRGSAKAAAKEVQSGRMIIR